LDAAVETIFLMPKEEYTFVVLALFRKSAAWRNVSGGSVQACALPRRDRKFGLMIFERFCK